MKLGILHFAEVNLTMPAGGQKVTPACNVISYYKFKLQDLPIEGVYPELFLPVGKIAEGTAWLTQLGLNQIRNIVTKSAGKGIAESIVERELVGMSWGAPINKQGLPFEDYIASGMPASSRLPANFKTFDFFDRATGEAISVKTLDTSTAAKLNNPVSVYNSLKQNVDATLNFERYSLGTTEVVASDISHRVVQVAVPNTTTSAQWSQIARAIEYAQSHNVTLTVTVVK